jgi:hypothetical protein
VAQYHVSGTVRDADGLPASNVRVELETSFTSPTAISRVFTDASGFYEFRFETFQSPLYLQPNLVGVLHYDGGSRGGAVFPIGRGEVEMVKNVFFQRPRRVKVGEPFSIALEHDSQSCFDGDNILDFDRLCGGFVIDAESSGTLRVSVTAPGGAARPFILHSAVGTMELPDGISFPVQAGQSYGLSVAIPRGAAPVQITVTTAME